MPKRHETNPSRVGSRAAPADYRARAAYYRRIFGRGIGHCPTVELKLALDRAAYAAVDAWRVRNNPELFTETGRIAILREDRLSQKAMQVAIDRDRNDRPTRPMLLQMAGAR